jgi:hypothetical protein
MEKYLITRCPEEGAPLGGSLGQARTFPLLFLLQLGSVFWKLVPVREKIYAQTCGVYSPISSTSIPYSPGS